MKEKLIDAKQTKVVKWWRSINNKIKGELVCFNIWLGLDNKCAYTISVFQQFYITVVKFNIVLGDYYKGQKCF